MSVEIYGDSSNPRAIVIRSSHKAESIEFLTPLDYSLQVGVMSRPAGYAVAPHIHNQIVRTIEGTQEVLIIRNGECEINLFNIANEIDATISVFENDVILLAHGGHGITMKTDCEILEVKQGPYVQVSDKRFISEEK